MSEWEEDTWVDPGVLVGLKKGEIRQAGHTSHQMQRAPERALYIWCSGDVTYPKNLARFLGREDLRVVSSSYMVLDHRRHDVMRQHGAKHYVVDHAYWSLNKSTDLLSRTL